MSLEELLRSFLVVPGGLDGGSSHGAEITDANIELQQQEVSAQLSSPSSCSCV